MPSKKAPKSDFDSNSHLAAIIESAEDAIISKDLNGIIVSWNRSAETIFGYSSDEIVGRSIMLLIPPDRADEEPIILEKLKRGERIEHFETVRLAKDGRELDVALTISPIKDSEGKVIGASKIVRDVTRQKQTERALEETRAQLEAYARDLEKKVHERTARLQEAVNELEAFSYSVSHDLRAPLRAMRQYSEALLEDHGKELDETGRGYLQRIANSGTKLDTMIRDVLIYSRTIRAKEQLQPVNLDNLVHEIIRQYPNFHRYESVIEVQSPLLPMIGQEAFLTQSISNLLGNAIKFMADGGEPKIRVWTEARGPKVRLWIEDNGIGIDPRHHARIFNMFERVHGGSDYEGTGIGLAIVRKSVERMGGTVGVESKLGAGSKFWIELPGTTE